MQWHCFKMISARSRLCGEKDARNSQPLESAVDLELRDIMRE